MNSLKLYSISDEYIEYLRNTIPEVYSNKITHRAHSRKYLGVVININKYPYYIPLSSPKRSDYQYAAGKLVVKKSIVPIVRITEKNSIGEKELKGTLRISHMIPVPSSELTLYNLDDEKDIQYKNIVFSELRFIRKNSEMILKRAHTMYTQKIQNNESATYIKSALDYHRLEKLFDNYKHE